MSDEALLNLAAEMEGHPDNVAQRSLVAQLLPGRSR